MTCDDPSLPLPHFASLESNEAFSESSEMQNPFLKRGHPHGVFRC